MQNKTVALELTCKKIPNNLEDKTPPTPAPTKHQAVSALVTFLFMVIYFITAGTIFPILNPNKIMVIRERALFFSINNIKIQAIEITIDNIITLIFLSLLVKGIKTILDAAREIQNNELER